MWICNKQIYEKVFHAESSRSHLVLGMSKKAPSRRRVYIEVDERELEAVLALLADLQVVETSDASEPSVSAGPAPQPAE